MFLIINIKVLLSGRKINKMQLTTQQIYFISYNYGYGYGYITLKTEKLNKKNINNWFIKIKKAIIKDIRGHKIKNIGKIIILNIKEIN